MMEGASFSDKFNELNIGLRIQGVTICAIRENPVGDNHPQLWGPPDIADALVYLALLVEPRGKGLADLGRFSANLKNLAAAIDRRCKSPERHISESARSFSRSFGTEISPVELSRGGVGGSLNEISEEDWSYGVDDRN